MRMDDVAVICIPVVWNLQKRDVKRRKSVLTSFKSSKRRILSKTNIIYRSLIALYNRSKLSNESQRGE